MAWFSPFLSFLSRFLSVRWKVVFDTKSVSVNDVRRRVVRHGSALRVSPRLAEQKAEFRRIGFDWFEFFSSDHSSPPNEQSHDRPWLSAGAERNGDGKPPTDNGTRDRRIQPARLRRQRKEVSGRKPSLSPSCSLARSLYLCLSALSLGSGGAIIRQADGSAIP